MTREQELQEQLELGTAAERFQQYIDENPYFKGLLERIKLEYARQILSLGPDETGAFTRSKVAIAAMDSIPEAITGDIYLASQALKELNGEQEGGGIL